MQLPKLSSSAQSLCVVASITVLVFFTGCGQQRPGSSTEGLANVDETIGVWEQQLDAAMAASERGDQGATEQQLLTALQIANQIAEGGDHYFQRVSLFYLAELYLEVGRHTEAERGYRSVLEAMEGDEDGDAYEIAAVKLRLGTCLNETEQWEEANQLLEDGFLVVQNDSEDPSALLGPLCQLAFSQVGTRDLESAFESVDQIAGIHLQIPERQRDFDALARTLIWLIEIGVESGKREELKDLMITATEIAEKNRLDGETTRRVFETALAYSNLMRWPEAARYAEARITDLNQDIYGSANHITPDPNQSGGEMSEAKHFAYDEMLQTKRELDRQQRRWDAENARYEAQRDLDSQLVGPAGAMGVSEMYFMTDPPDPYVQRDLYEAEIAYLAAREHYMQTP